jgi:hypothetical protein
MIELSGTGRWDLALHVASGGRSFDSPKAVERSGDDEPFLKLTGGEWSERSDLFAPMTGWWLTLHDGTTDDEHDAAYLAKVTLVAPTLVQSWQADLSVVAIVSEALFYGSMGLAHENTEVCDSEDYHSEGSEWPKGHLIGKRYTPPTNEFTELLQGRFVRVDMTKRPRGKGDQS